MSKLLEYLNESPTVFFILKKDKNWHLEYVTQNVVNIYGYEASSFLNKEVNHEQFIYEDDLQSFIAEAKKVSSCKEKEFVYKPYRIKNATNEIVWVNHITKIIRDEKGNPSYYFGYLTDITLQKELYSKLEVTQNILDSIFNDSHHYITLLSNKGKVLKINNTSLELLNINEEDILHKNFWEGSWWSESEKTKIQNEIEIIKDGSCLKSKKTYINSDNSKVYLDLTYTPILDEHKNLIYIICEAYDITQIQKNKRELQEYINIVNENVLISRTDTKGFIIDASDAYCKFTGYSKEELIGNTHSILKHPDNTQEMFSDLWNTINSGKCWKGEIKNIKKDGSMFWVENSISANLDEDGNIIGFTSIYYDITDKKEISELLITDFLTKIYNRRHFNTIFDLELKRSIRHKKTFVLMILDIDFFKQYNDTYGHDAGDKVLFNVAQTLKSTLKRSEDFVFRLGGEEFGIITSSINVDGLYILARKLRQSIQNLQIEHCQSKTNKYLSISIGMKLVEHDSFLCQNDIYKLADEALYKAKESGRNKAVLCTKNSLDDKI